MQCIIIDKQSNQFRFHYETKNLARIYQTAGANVLVIQWSNATSASCWLSCLAVIGEFPPQTDQRSDDSNLQHVKGETGRNHYKAVS